MQPTASSANSDRCKENPYHQTDNNCVRTGQCPYHNKPARMYAGDFRPGEPVSLDDNFCYICRSRVIDCPTTPHEVEKRHIEAGNKDEVVRDPPRWIRLAIGAGVLMLLAGVIWWLTKPPAPKPIPHYCQEGTVSGDTCINNETRQILCDGKGRYRLSKPIGKCGPLPLVTHCSKGEVVGTICQGNDMFQKVCDGQDGFKKGKRIGRCGPPPVAPECRGDRLLKQVNGNYYLYTCQDGKPTGFRIIRPGDDDYPDK